jgi:hypothetical protein
MSLKDRQRAESNRLIREVRNAGLAGGVEVQVTVEFEDTPGLRARVWGVDPQRVGPSRDPYRDRRDYIAVRLVRSARAVGWRYEDAVTLAVHELRHLKLIGDRDTVAAALANSRLPKEMILLDAGEVEARARKHGMETTISRTKK